MERQQRYWTRETASGCGSDRTAHVGIVQRNVVGDDRGGGEAASSACLASTRESMRIIASKPAKWGICRTIPEVPGVCSMNIPALEGGWAQKLRHRKGGIMPSAKTHFFPPDPLASNSPTVSCPCPICSTPSGEFVWLPD